MMFTYFNTGYGLFELVSDMKRMHPVNEQIVYHTSNPFNCCTLHFHTITSTEKCLKRYLRYGFRISLFSEQSNFP